jgi:hypothetical protein
VAAQSSLLLVTSMGDRVNYYRNKDTGDMVVKVGEVNLYYTSILGWWECSACDDQPCEHTRVIVEAGQPADSTTRGGGAK